MGGNEDSTISEGKRGKNNDSASQSVTQIVFKKDRSQSIDFEVALSALIASGVFVSLSENTEYRPLILAAAGILLLITLLRRMAIVGRFSREKFVIKVTQVPVKFLSIICIFQILRALGRNTLNTSGFLSLNAIVLAFVGIYLSVHQLLYRDYRLYWGTYFIAVSKAFSEGQVSSSGLITGKITEELADTTTILSFSLLRGAGIPADVKSVELQEAQRWVKDNEESIENGEISEPNPASGLGVVLALFLVFISPVIIFVYILFPNFLQVIVALISVYSLGHLIEFLYLGYGAPVKRPMLGWKAHLSLTVIYLITVIEVFA